MGDQLRFVDDSGDTRLAGELVDDGATVGDVLTVQSDGSLAAATGGGSIPSGAGLPLSSVTPSGIGALYIDVTNGGLWIAIGVTDDDWVIVGGSDGGAGSFGVGVDPTVGNIAVTSKAGGNASLNGGGNFDGVIVNDFDDSVQIASRSAELFWIRTLPAADPHLTGRLWNNSGVVTVSAG